ncbi:anti-sigma factor family protein [Oleiharenicola lentus]|uniref:anti-sigma factor family protein n=1 Tax=Oleiharenicola lentus TaxID=2508720 RepID=UPI003F678E8C
MNDHRFIELVNLYVDREITAAETAELELEIQSNPSRRAIYQQYCKMNRATAMVYDSFRAQATEPSAKIVGGGTIEKFVTAKSKRVSPVRYVVGSLAAAACVAFALVQFNGTQTSASNDLVAQSSAPAVQVAAVAPQATPVQSTAEVHTTYAGLRSSESEQHYSALLTALRNEEQRSFADAQLKASRAPSLFEDGVFDSKRNTETVNYRLYRNQQSATQPQAEFTAFQFQR